MKQKFNPAMAITAVVVLVLVAGLFIWKAGTGVSRADNEKPSGMPTDVAQEFQKRMGGTTGPGGTNPPANAPLSIPAGAANAPMGAPDGASAGPQGYIAPPSR